MERLKDKKFLIIAAVLLVAVVAYFVLGKAPEQAKPAAPLPEVATQTLAPAPLTKKIVLSGETKSFADIKVAPKYAGRVLEVRADLGDHVQTGDVLLIMDTAELDLEIRQNQAQTDGSNAESHVTKTTFEENLLSLETSHRIAQTRLERKRHLYSLGAISRDEFETAESEFKAKDALYQAAVREREFFDGTPASVLAKEYAAKKNKYATEVLEQKREEMVLRAAFPGVISYRAADVGAYLGAGQEVFRLVDNSQINVDVIVGENDVTHIQEGSEIPVFIDSLGKEYLGKITFVSSTMEADARGYLVRISLDNPDESIKAGLFARGELNLIQKQAALFLPKDAIIKRIGKVYVYVVEGESVRMQEVKTGLINDQEEEIIEGLQAGDTVAISNLDRLKDGSKIKIKE